MKSKKFNMPKKKINFRPCIVAFYNKSARINKICGFE